MRANAATNRPLNSSELARLAHVSPDTLRYYERRGLLPSIPRSAAGYRLYPKETLLRVQMIRGALSIGFSVTELAGIFRERNSGAAPCHRVRKMAAEKLVDLEARVRDLRDTLREWDRLLIKTPHGKQARLLETFTGPLPNGHTRKLPLGKRKLEKK